MFLSDDDAVLELTGVGREFPGTPPVHALRDVELRVARGDHLAIVGPSGSGKSTLLNIVGLLDRPSAGRYILDGIETCSLSENQRAALRGHRIGFVFQDFQLLSQRTAWENAAMGALYVGISTAERRKRAVAALERVGLGHRLNTLPQVMSGGEKQRVAIARALVVEPSLLLCDEPTGNLDSTMADQVLDVFDALNRSGTTLVVITHDPRTAARARRMADIRDGYLTEKAPEKLPHRPSSTDGALHG